MGGVRARRRQWFSDGTVLHLGRRLLVPRESRRRMVCCVLAFRPLLCRVGRKEHGSRKERKRMANVKVRQPLNFSRKKVRSKTPARVNVVELLYIDQCRASDMDRGVTHQRFNFLSLHPSIH